MTAWSSSSTSRRRANIAPQAPDICWISSPPPDRSPMPRLPSSLAARFGRTASALNRLIGLRAKQTERRNFMPRSNSRGGRNNNPSGRNQYSDWGVMDMVRERPVAAAAAAAGAAAAGLFLWSKRSQISGQLSNLSDQIGEWTDNMRLGDDSNMMDDTAGLTTSRSSMRSGAGSRSASGTVPASRNRGMSETGGGNASLGARSGGGGIRSNASSRGRAKGIPSTT